MKERDTWEITTLLRAVWLCHLRNGAEAEQCCEYYVQSPLTTRYSLWPIHFRWFVV